MSVTIALTTEYVDTEQTVKFKLASLRMDNINDKPNLRAWGKLEGFIGGSSMPVAKFEAEMNLSDILDNFTTQEKTAAKAFIVAYERTLKNRVPKLTDSSAVYDDTDAF